MANVILHKIKCTNPYNNTKKNYYNDDAVENAIKYIYRKNAKGKFNLYGTIGTFYTDPNNIVNDTIDDFMRQKNIHHKSDGLQLVHYILSFPANFQVPPKKKFQKLIIRTAKIWGKDFQVAYALHEDTDNLHVHFIINSTSYAGYKISINEKRFHKYQKLANKIWCNI